MGIVKPTTLRKNRKYALLACAVVAAITTPADVISMMLMLVPLYCLYEFGILLLILAPAKRVAEGAVPRARSQVREDDVVRGVVDRRRCGQREEREPPEAPARGPPSGLAHRLFTVRSDCQL